MLCRLVRYVAACRACVAVLCALGYAVVERDWGGLFGWPLGLRRGVASAEGEGVVSVVELGSRRFIVWGFRVWLL
jgi:hypothetical protein